MKNYDLDDLSQFGIRHVGSECCGLCMRTHFGLTKEAWEAWCHFTGQVQMIEHPRAFLTQDYATLVIPRDWLQDFLIYLALQAGAKRVLVVIADQHESWYRIWNIWTQEGESDPDFDRFLESCQANHIRYYVVNPDPTAEREHGFRNRHYWTGEIE